MKKALYPLLAFLAAAANLFGMVCCTDDRDENCYSECCSDCFGFDSELTFGIGGGYRVDQLQWTVFPSLTGDEVKEKWHNLQMGIVEADVKFVACENYLLLVDFDYGWFNRRGNQSVKTFDLVPASPKLIGDLKSRTRGRVYDLEGAIGYQFNFCCDHYSIAPLVGYSYHFQKFKNRHYEDEESGAEVFADINNRYTFRWRGPFVGFTTAYQIDPYWNVYFAYAYHWVRYRAKLNEEFVVSAFPTHQKANRVRGNEFVLGTNFEFCDSWFFGIKVDYKNYFSNKGSETSEGIIVSNLRDLRWKSFSATIEVAYQF